MPCHPIKSRYHMLNPKTYREWLSHNELPLQTLIDLLEGIEPAATDFGLLARYKRYYNDNSSPVGFFSEEEYDGGLVDEFCEGLLGTDQIGAYIFTG